MGTVYAGTGKVFQEIQSVELDPDSIRDMQKRIKVQPKFLGEPLVVIAEQDDLNFERTEDNSLDLLALDVKGNTVLITLFAGIADAQSDLHSLQLAAHVASLHPEELGKITRSFIGKPQNDAIRRAWEEKGVEMNEEAVELSSLLASTFERDADDYSQSINVEQRVVLAAEGFTSRLVEMIRWLHGSGVSITGLRYRKFLVGGQEIYFAEQVVPMSEPAVDAPEQSRQPVETLEPWRTKGKIYHAERLAPSVVALLDNLLVVARPSTFSVNWSHKYYFWIRGSRRNFRVRTYHRDRLELGFDNAAPKAVSDFLARYGLDWNDVNVVGGYGDSPFITLNGDMRFDDKWNRMLNDWLSGGDAETE